MKKILMFFTLLMVAFACNDYTFEVPKDGLDGLNGLDGKDGLNASWRTEVFGPSNDYPAGGVRVVPGWNTPAGFVSDEDNAFIVTNGLDGSNGVGALIPQFEIRDCILYDGQTPLGNVCGIDGINGTNGKDGVDGKDGTNGTNGTDGVNGVNGVDGVDGVTKIPFPVVTEIPPTAEHTNGGWMYTWLYLDEFNQIVSVAPVIGAYPVWHGNDGANGTNGQNGQTPTIGEDGFWHIGEFNTGVRAEGINGTNGSDGLTPYIDDQTGTWWIGDYDTGVMAQGTQGVQGPQGIPGTPGSNGLTPYIGENGNWWIGGIDTEVNAQGTPGTDGLDGQDGTNGTDGVDGNDGEDGKSPFIGENNYWYVWSDNEGSYINTNVYSIGAPGAVGAQGETGATGAAGEQGPSGLTPYIGTNGNWFIGNTDTGVTAEGQDGTNGNNGTNGTNGTNGQSPYVNSAGYWMVYSDVLQIYMTTLVKAYGTDGTNGTNGTNGADGSTITGVTSTPITGGQIITLMFSDNTSYTFQVMDGAPGGTGPQGIQGPQGIPGQDGKDGDCNCIETPFCSGNFYTLFNKTIINEGFNDEEVPNGWSGTAGQYYDFITDRLVAKTNSGPTNLYTPAFQLASVSEITMLISEYTDDKDKFVEAFVQVFGSTTWISLGKVAVLTDYPANQTVTWNTGLTNVSKVRFEFTGNATDHIKSKVVIDNVKIVGNEVVCVTPCNTPQ
jgi:hypothetical protein